MRFLFLLLVLHRGQEEEYWKAEGRKHQGSLQIVLKARHTGILCALVDLLFNFLKKGKKALFFNLFTGISLCLCPNTFISYSVDVKTSPSVFLSDFTL